MSHLVTEDALAAAEVKADVEEIVTLAVVGEAKADVAEAKAAEAEVKADAENMRVSRQKAVAENMKESQKAGVAEVMVSIMADLMKDAVIDRKENALPEKIKIRMERVFIFQK